MTLVAKRYFLLIDRELRRLARIHVKKKKYVYRLKRYK